MARLCMTIFASRRLSTTKALNGEGQETLIEGTSPTIVTEAKWIVGEGGQALKFAKSTNGKFTYNGTMAAGRTYSVQFGFVSSALPSAGTDAAESDFFVVNTASSDPVELSLSTAGELKFWNGVASSEYPTGIKIAAATKYYIEVQFLIPTSGNGTMAVKVREENGKQVGETFTKTGINMGTSTATKISIGHLSTSNTTCDFYFSQFVVNDSTGTSQTSWVGYKKVVFQTPVSDNANTKWTRSTSSTTTELFKAVRLVPPEGKVLASRTAESQIVSPEASETNLYTANLQSYTEAGIREIDTVDCVVAVARVAQTATTSRNVTLTLTNPTGSETRGTSSSKGEADPTGWNTVTIPPVYTAPTKGTKPTLKIAKATGSAFVVMCDWMGLYVSYEPGTENEEEVNWRESAVVDSLKTVTGEETPIEGEWEEAWNPAGGGTGKKTTTGYAFVKSTVVSEEGLSRKVGKNYAKGGLIRIEVAALPAVDEYFDLRFTKQDEKERGPGFLCVYEGGNTWFLYSFINKNGSAGEKILEATIELRAGDSIGMVWEESGVVNFYRLRNGLVTKLGTATTLAPASEAIKPTLHWTVESGAGGGAGRLANVAFRPLAETESAHLATLTPGVESDAAIAPGRLKRRAPGQASETSTAIAPGRVKRLALVPAVETSTAIASARLKRRVPGQALEVDTAVALHLVKRLQLLGALEADAAVALRLAKRLQLLGALEADVAQAPTIRRILALLPVLEVDEAIAPEFAVVEDLVLDRPISMELAHLVRVLELAEPGAKSLVLAASSRTLVLAIRATAAILEPRSTDLALARTEREVLLDG